MAQTAPRPLLLLLGLAALALTATLAVASSAGAATERHVAGKIAKNKPIYDGLWKRRVSAANKRWARRVSRCESGRNPNALGSGGRYRGAFQFSRSTWVDSPRSPGGDPVAYSYRTQAFVAVRLRTRGRQRPLAGLLLSGASAARPRPRRPAPPSFDPARIREGRCR